MVKYNVKLPDVKYIEKLALNALKKDLNNVLKNAAVEIRNKIPKLITNSITSSPEYKSINGGRLQGELGLSSPTVLDDIINQWASNIGLKVRPVRTAFNRLSGGFTITAIQDDWEDVLRNPSAEIVTKKGQVLPWLEWLLTMGNKVIIRDYEIYFGGRAGKRSRSGQAIMVQGKGSRWRVPPEFSGISDDNFVTRSLEAVRPTIENMIESEVMKQVK